MSDIINLLPDAVANQIAAGEVIQRPASALKELLENAVDAGADEINIYIKDAGKSLIQVSDNGCGMSETDARMCFERHATSKINSANDLFAIKTLGFRGEALASIAAISQLELKTKKVEDELGSCLKIEGARFISQDVCACDSGTSLSIKNLFFNVPARRKFLKSNTAEMRHIQEEYHRVALVNSQVSFCLYINDKLASELPSGNIKQRIVSVFGNNYNQRLVSVEQETETLRIKGFILKPEFSKKTRGEQYFFVNGRYIKHAYLHHAVGRAFDELIPSDAYPSYFIFIEIDPQEVDINIHPTKTEVNFSNQQYVYAVLSSAVKESLGKFNITPSINFELSQEITIPQPPPPGKEIKAPGITIDPDFNPFASEQNFEKPKYHKSTGSNFHHDWRSHSNKDASTVEQTAMHTEDQSALSFSENENYKAFQLHNRYIVSTIKSGLVIIDQHRAHARILYEKYLKQEHSVRKSAQQQLFPVTLTLSPEDVDILNEIKDEILNHGFEIEDFGKNTFVINAYPTGTEASEVAPLIEEFIEQFKNRAEDIGLDKKSTFARAMALNKAMRYGKKLEQREMNNLIDRLFGCQVPDVSPDGFPVFRIITIDEFNKYFQND